MATLFRCCPNFSAIQCFTVNSCQARLNEIVYKQGKVLPLTLSNSTHLRSHEFPPLKEKIPTGICKVSLIKVNIDLPLCYIIQWHFLSLLCYTHKGNLTWQYEGLILGKLATTSKLWLGHVCHTGIWGVSIYDSLYVCPSCIFSLLVLLYTRNHSLLTLSWL